MKQTQSRVREVMGDFYVTNADPRTLITREEAAELISREFFPIKKKTLEKWPLTVRRVNGRALVSVDEVRAVCAAKIKSAPAHRSAGKTS